MGLEDHSARAAQGHELSGQGFAMRRLGRRATKVLTHPGAFALAVLKGFRANQGVLLAGAVAYYTLLSLVPLLILSLMALSHLFSEDQLLQTLREYLEFVVPGQSSALVQELRTFLAHREVVGGFLLVTMLFFSALAFTVLENAMSVIFFHRVAIKRRHLPGIASGAVAATSGSLEPLRSNAPAAWQRCTSRDSGRHRPVLCCN